MNVISIGSDNVLNLDGLSDVISGTPVNNAVVTAQLSDAVLGTLIGSDISLTSLGSGGNYQGLLPASTTSLLVQGQAVYCNYQALFGIYELTDRPLAIATYSAE